MKDVAVIAAVLGLTPLAFAQAQVVVPSEWQLIIGKRIRGDLASLQSDDGVPLVLEQLFRAELTPITRFDVRCHSSISVFLHIQFKTKTRSVTGGNYYQSVLMKDYTTNTFVKIGDYNLLVGYQTFVGDATGNLSRFRRQSDGEMTARIEVWPRQPYLISAQNPSFAFDFCAWTLFPV